VITVTRRTITHDEATGLTSEVVSTITGSAFASSRGEADAYRELSLTRSKAPLLIFTASGYTRAEDILPGDTLQWPEDGDTFTVRSARAVDPDGRGAIIWYLVVSR
jgi:hypothetical protein